MATVLKVYYTIDYLFENVTMESSYMAKNIRTEDGDDMTEEYTMTEDERDLFMKYCKQAALEIFKDLGFMFNTFEQLDDDVLEEDYTPFEFDVNQDIDEDGTIEENLIIFRFVEPKNFYRDMLPALQEKIEEVLIGKILTKWYYNIRLRDEAEKTKAYTEDLVKQMRSLALFKTKPAKKKHHTL